MEKTLFKKYSLQMVAETNTKYTSPKINKFSIKNSIAVVDIINTVFHLDKQAEEYCILLCLNSKNFINAAFEISHGNCNSAILEVANVLKRALITNSPKIIVAHNHPSGDSTPSKADYSLTDRLYDSAELLGIQLIDHIIIGNGNYNSLLSSKKEGVLL
ncbi:MAG: JAB domain-containing protein [Clostridia bacterium]|nr:JAB domain-containing protein [Clostridia bacterium]